MLAVTQDAAIAIRSLMDRQDMPEGCGLRLAGADDGSGALELSAAPAPEAEDAVVEAEGARVFLDPAVAPVLDDKVLDAGRDEAGRIRFRLVAA